MQVSESAPTSPVFLQRRVLTNQFWYFVWDIIVKAYIVWLILWQRGANLQEKIFRLGFGNGELRRLRSRSLCSLTGGSGLAIDRLHETLAGLISVRNV